MCYNVNTNVTVFQKSVRARRFYLTCLGNVSPAMCETHNTLSNKYAGSEEREREALYLGLR